MRLSRIKPLDAASFHLSLDSRDPIQTIASELERSRQGRIPLTCLELVGQCLSDGEYPGLGTVKRVAESALATMTWRYIPRGNVAPVHDHEIWEKKKRCRYANDQSRRGNSYAPQSRSSTHPAATNIPCLSGTSPTTGKKSLTALSMPDHTLVRPSP
jgi:hypothetical protein